MAKTLKQVMEVYRPKSKDEQKFIDKHVVSKTEDANGNGDDVFNASNVKTVDRKKEKHGNSANEDEKVYEETGIEESDITSALLEIYAECNDEERAELINIIEEGQLDSFLEMLAEELEEEELNG